MHFGILLFLIVVPGLSLGKAVLQCEPEWDYYNGKCYWFSDTARLRPLATTLCGNMNASLVIADSPDVHDYLMSKGLQNAIWLGLDYILDTSVTADWRWADGSPKDYSNWGMAPGEVHPCVSAFEDGEWYNIQRCSHEHNYVCKKSANGSACEADFTEFNDNCYFFSTDSYSNMDAALDCINRQSALASILSAAENNYIDSQMSGPSWIGLYPLFWNDGSVYHWHNWDIDGPTLGSPCAIMQVPSGEWTAVSCISDPHYYACEKEAGSGAPPTGEPPQQTTESVIDPEQTTLEQETEEPIVPTTAEPPTTEPPTGNQDLIDYLANFTKVEWDVVNNFPGGYYDANLKLINTGNEDVTELGWGIYFCSIRILYPSILKPSGNNGADIGASGLKVYHIAGCLHAIKPTPTFSGFQAGQTIDLNVMAEHWQVSRTDTSPNWYVAEDHTLSEERTILSTAGESLDFVADFTLVQEWRRSPADLYDPYTAGVRYSINRAALIPNSPNKWIIPTPVFADLDDNQRIDVQNGEWVVYTEDPTLVNTAMLLADKLSLDYVPLPKMNKILKEKADSRYIELILGEVTEADGTPVVNDEAYRIDISVTLQDIKILGNTVTGVYYGAESFVSLQDNYYKVGVPDGIVVDYPRFPYRGMMVDSSRNFKSKNEILELLEVMGMYKLNKFHFHLTDDEGWRLEIPDVEELTEVGGERCHDLDEDECLVHQLGSGPGEQGNSGTGYYTVDDYKEIIQYAADRHIEVIPEFDSPGHGRAAIKAMEARYRRYIDTDPGRANEYLLTDPDDTSDYLSIQYFRDNAMNPCMESTFALINKVILEVQQMHAGINELKTLHFGGDEVPSAAWQGSPICQQLFPGQTNAQLKQMFAFRVAADIAGFGLNTAAWEDGLMDGNNPYDRNSFPQGYDVLGNAWDNVWEWGRGSRAYIMANNDYKVILSHVTHNYFDHPYEPDPEERGLYWGTRLTPIRETFGYMPDTVYENMEWGLNGEALDKDTICQQHGCVPLEPGKEANVVGVQGQLWSETVRTKSQFNYMIFPRLLALAERAWHKADWESIMGNDEERNTQRSADWEVFANSLGQKELPRLSDIGVEYRVPIPGARAETAFDVCLLVARIETPGLDMEYSIDNMQTWNPYSMGAASQVPCESTIYVRTRSHDNRYSPVISVTSPPPGPLSHKTRGNVPH